MPSEIPSPLWGGVRGGGGDAIRRLSRASSLSNPQHLLHQRRQRSANGAGVGGVEMDAVERRGCGDRAGIEEAATIKVRDLTVEHGEFARFGDAAVEHR